MIASLYQRIITFDLERQGDDDNTLLAGQDRVISDEIAAKL